MNNKLVVGNWKMNGDRVHNQALLERLVGRVRGSVQCVVCVPFPYLEQAQGLLRGSGIELGGQDVSEFPDGAHTGEVSGAMLGEFGCRFVIVGHSERRTLLGEDDLLVARKAAAALKSRLTPIVCIGESLAEREAGQTEVVLRRQLDALATVLDVAAIGRLVIAYEPVWAIGTGRAASPEQVQAALAFIRSWLSDRVGNAGSVKILYGGSVKPESAEALFRLPDSDGGLIGAASLVAEQFLGICEAADVASQSVGENSKVLDE